MKNFCILPLVAALALFASCGKQQTEEERNAEVERQVQQKVAAEHQADDQQRLAQQQADLDAREKALAAKEAVSVTPEPTVRTRVAQATATPRRARESSDRSERRSSASYGTFYQKLEPYGAWRETNDYGYVFQPRQAEQSRTWRPYTEGHWVYSDAGWTWVSEEKFGWATYHYGRWVRLRNVGWCWVPGEQWAPAWVSWRTSKDYVGWAPLPPEAHFDRRSGIHNWADNYYDIGPEQYSFVSANELGSQRLERALVPVEQNVTIVNQTTNVTNITYNDTTIVNQGPDYEQYRSRSQQPIERYRLETRTDITDESARPIVRGEMISMAAPVIGVTAGFERPPTVRERLTQAVVENGWSAITDRSAAEKTRAKMKAEATPPPDAPTRVFVKPEAVAATAASPTPSATPASTVAATASPTASPAATEAAVIPTATPKPTIKPRPTPSPTPTAAPTATPKATPSPTATPAPTESDSSGASPTVTPETNPAMIPTRGNPRDGQRRQAEARRRAEIQAKATPHREMGEPDAANQFEEKQAHPERDHRGPDSQNKKRNAAEAAAAAPSSASTPEATPTPTQRPKATPQPTPVPTATPVAEAAPAASTPPSAIETPPPSEAISDVRRRPGGKKSENGRRALPANPAAESAQQAEPNPSSDASASPAEAAATPLPKGKKQKNKQRHPGEPEATDDATSAATPTPTVEPQ